MSLDELAEQTGTTVSYVQRLTDLGILSGDGDGVLDADLRRIRLVRQLDRSGIAPETIGKAVSLGVLSLDLVDALVPNRPALESKTLIKVGAELDFPPEAMTRLYVMWGLVPPAPDDEIRQEDAALFGAWAAAGSRDSLTQGLVQQAAGMLGETAHRIVDFAYDYLVEHSLSPRPAPGVSPGGSVDAGIAAFNPATETLQRTLVWLLRRQIEHHATQFVIEYVEGAIEKAGLMPGRQPVPHAIAFVDLAGFTSLSEKAGDDVAADKAAALADTVYRIAQAGGGQLMKLLGDGAMLYFADPSVAAGTSLDLVEGIDESGLPPARVGMAVGPVVFRDGDCYGQTVNVAARLLDRAQPRQVLVTSNVIEHSDTRSFRFDRLGEAKLKGLSAPVSLAIASRRL